MLDSKKNLIYLGTLKSFEYKYFGEGGVIRFSEGLLFVIEGNKVNDFYFLQGSTVTSLVNVHFFDYFRLLAMLALRSEKEEHFMSCISYSSAVGIVMYVVVCKCPYISYAISVVSCYMANHGKLHYYVVKLIL